MSGKHQRGWFWPAAGIVAVLCSTLTANTQEIASDKSTVRVDILEGLPDQPPWDFTSAQVSETYNEPAFGFVTLPTKYSHKGIKIDLAVPFLFRASARITLPAGEHRLLLRSRTGSRLKLDGNMIAATPFPNVKADGHEEVPEEPAVASPDLRYPRPGHFEALTTITSDGREHVFTLEALIGAKGRRPELGELTVSLARGDDSTFYLLAPTPKQIAYSEEGWNAYETDRRATFKAQDQKRRRDISQEEDGYWLRRHQWARKTAKPAPAPPRVSSMPINNAIDHFIGARLEAAKVPPSKLTDEYAFLRRLTLDTIGIPPTPEQIQQFLRDPKTERRARAIDRLLRHTGWADHWVSYWQDVLAENPGLVKPMLNNTGPFRWFIHDAFADNKPMDRFASELIMMEGSVHYGGPAGFGVATENDVPMAAKAQIISQAFLGMEMQCARCHDAPYHDFKQQDLFSLAAMLRREPQQVPLSSTVPTNANIVIGRVVNVTLKPGTKVEPKWPFSEIAPDDVPPDVLRNPNDPREKLAALVTDPRNQRFARVIVNRVWKRYLGWGIVEPIDDWETAAPSHPELLDWLAHELVTHDYDLKHVARLILNSHAYQREPSAEGSKDVKPELRLFASPARRRMTAEQITDSLFAAVGKSLQSEEMNLDVDGRRPVKDFNNLGIPSRAWEFASLSNERDRPALSLPKAQMIVDCLCTFGWREARQNPATVRDDSPNVLQSATLANGLMANGRIARLSDDNTMTTLALRDQPLNTLIHSTFVQMLSRPPTEKETRIFTSYLGAGYADRFTEPSAAAAFKRPAPRRPVSWSNHLNPEATRLKQEWEREARAGDPPTERLRPDWRERMEDAVWALANSPEFIFVP